MSTHVLSAKEIKRSWHLFDATDQVLGRLAQNVATKLMGKHKPNFVPYLDNGDFVVITNASKIKITGKKPTQKTYYHHSGYPGGLRSETFEKLLVRRPEEVFRHAVVGMLPKTKLGKKMIKKVYIFKDENHPFAKQIGEAK